eukprot:gene11209-biopygen246
MSLFATGIELEWKLPIPCETIESKRIVQPTWLKN